MSWRLCTVDLEAAYNWLADKPPVHWSKSHLSTFPKCDILVNNICENFNKCILDARSKPILGLLEGLRNYMMSSMQACRDKVAKWDGLICPKIKERIEIAKKEAGGCIATCSGNKKFQVTAMFGSQYTVDLSDMTCSCGKWKLSGIPCPYSISCMYFLSEEVEGYVHQCYYIEIYKKIYKPIINQMNGMDMWPKSLMPTVLPPEYNPQPGRPKENKRRNRVDEPQKEPTKLRKRHQKSLRRSVCGTLEHNKMSCKMPKTSGGSATVGSNSSERRDKRHVHMASEVASNGKAVWTKPITLKRAKLDVRRAVASSTQTMSQCSSVVTTKSPPKHIFA